jgi:hypothetical protein
LTPKFLPESRILYFLRAFGPLAPAPVSFGNPSVSGESLRFRLPASRFSSGAGVRLLAFPRGDFRHLRFPAMTRPTPKNPLLSIVALLKNKQNSHSIQAFNRLAVLSLPSAAKPCIIQGRRGASSDPRKKKEYFFGASPKLLFMRNKE